MTIWKFPLELKDEQTVTMPNGAEILSVQVQQGFICLWALCNPNPEVPRGNRRIFIHGTGHEVYANPKRFIGTVQFSGGALVFHVFEATEVYPC